MKTGWNSPAQLDQLLDELADVSCSCDHADHSLDTLRAKITRRVIGLRLGPCYRPGCGCRGGRA